ncbi:MAG: alpha/beta hydrolase [Elusimicrobiales bacterium]
MKKVVFLVLSLIRTVVFAGDEAIFKNDLINPLHKTVTGNVSVFSLPYFLKGRRVWVYLPPNYDKETSKSYPVLYMQDGQNLFDSKESFAGEWEVDESLEKIFSQNQASPFIVVGVDNGGAERLSEYTPWKDLRYGGGGADEYLKNLKDYLMPEINRRYRTKTGPENTFIGGSSLGGLLSAYAVFAYPQIWGGALSMSPSYWWADKKFLDWFSSVKKPDNIVFYQDIGNKEGGEEAEEHLNNFREAERLFLNKGFVKNKDFFSLEFEGHYHNEKFWALRFPQAVILIFPVKYL